MSISLLVGISVLTMAVSFLPGAAAVTCNPVPHGPVLIQSDRDFTAKNGVVSGSGTSANPFLFSNLQVTDLSPGFALKVDNSKGKITKFFNIQCVQSNFMGPAPSGSIVVWIVNIHTATTISQVDSNSGRADGSVGIRIDSSSNIVLDNESINKFGFDGVQLNASDHITVIESKLKATHNGLTIKQGSHDITVGQTCDLSASSGTCNEFTYDDGWGLQVDDSYNITVQYTKNNADDTGGVLLNGSATHNVQLTNIQATGTGPVCPASIGSVPTGQFVDYIAGFAIINGAHDINLKSSTVNANTHFSLENGGDGKYLNPCTGLVQTITPVTPPGGANLDVNGNCYANEFGFTPVPTKVC